MTTFTLLSPETGTEYHIFVEAPPEAKRARRGAAATSPLPAMLFMDGDDQLRFAVDGYRAARAADEAPPLLLVGVGYGASYRDPKNKRGRDYTPTASSLEPSSGGADRFLAFLTQTLWPELARRFPLRDHARGIAGHSLGSLVVLHALFQHRPFFQRFLASAPSIWWDDRAILCAGLRLRDRQDALPGKLFLCVGENDTPSMTGDLTMLEDQLAARPFEKLEVTSRRFPDRDHLNVLTDAFHAGLATLYGGDNRAR